MPSCSLQHGTTTESLQEPGSRATAEGPGFDIMEALAPATDPGASMATSVQTSELCLNEGA